jgi:hypothetical protein
MPDAIRAQMESIADRALRNGDPRSPEYRLGLVDCLCRRAIDMTIQRHQRMGAAQADAYWAGYERGWTVWDSIKAVRVEDDTLADWNMR